MLHDVLLLVIGAAIGFVSQMAWRRYEAWLNRRQQPVVAVTQISRDGRVLAEIHNLGPDGVRELTVTADWISAGRPQQRKLSRFFRADENPTTSTPVTTEFIGAGDRLLVADVPSHSDEGIVTLTVRGLGLRSHDPLSHTSDIIVPFEP